MEHTQTSRKRNHGKRTSGSDIDWMLCCGVGDKEAKSEDGRMSMFKIKWFFIGGIQIKWIKINYFPVNVSLKIGRVYNLDIAYKGL
jgi:hypothetical protein